MRVLGQADWRGQEQAAILLTQLDHKPAADRFVELLSAARPEAFITAAWGLRRLAVRETLQPVLEYLQRTREQLRTSTLVGRRVITLDPFDLQLCQLCQFLGKSRYRPADGVLRLMVPRLKLPGSAAYLGDETRAATIWALGFIHEGKPVPEVDQALVGRLTDIGGMLGNEEPLVRRMCAISLGRMKAKETLPVLERFCTAQKATADQVNNACGWAIEQLTGRKMGPPGTMEGALPFLTGWLNAVEPKK
jgi:HEAT repeat protein